MPAAPRLSPPQPPCVLGGLLMVANKLEHRAGCAGGDAGSGSIRALSWVSARSKGKRDSPTATERPAGFIFTAPIQRGKAAQTTLRPSLGSAARQRGAWSCCGEPSQPGGERTHMLCSHLLSLCLPSGIQRTCPSQELRAGRPQDIPRVPGWVPTVEALVHRHTSAPSGYSPPPKSHSHRQASASPPTFIALVKPSNG